jgi:DNA-directed RNA polymerase beta subunit
MKKTVAILMMAAIFAGCAASSFKTARENANRVNNGMTLEQAEAVLGMPATDKGVNKFKWRRGNAQRYDATPHGAVEFNVDNGVIVGIPEGGVFGPLARQEYLRKLADDEAQRLAKKAASAKAEAVRQEREDAQATEEIAALMAASEQAYIVCRDKTNCTKIFSLAQIFITENADQKIQVATDTVIQTYNATADGNIAASIIKMPGSGSNEKITLTLNCKSEGAGFEKSCRAKQTRIYNAFRPYIEKNLAR